MHKLLAFLLLAVLTLGSVDTFAQEVPRPSPVTSIRQTVGISDVMIIYGSPAVKERKVWGELVPYGKVWRSGANEVTNITFEDDVKINGKDLDAGTYAFLTIPGKEKWTLIFNRDTEMWGAYNYLEEEDILRVEVKAEKNDCFEERLSYRFTDITDSSATVSLVWENLRIPFTVEFNTHEKVMMKIREALNQTSEEEKWRVLRNAAGYCAGVKDNLGEALGWIEESISRKDTWYSWKVKADVLAAIGQYGEAIKAANESIVKGRAKAQKDGNTFDYETDIQRDIEKWEEARKGM